MRVIVLLLLVTAVVNARPSKSHRKSRDLPTETLSHRNESDERAYKTTSSALEDSVKQVANQLTKSNRTNDFTMDIRTPPKIKFQQKNMEKKKAEQVENSHPGIAVPLDVEAFYESSTTQKRPVIYRNENKTPTPDSGLSTWILLSGQSTTSKPVRKQPTIKTTTTTSTEPEANKTFMTEKPVKGTIKIKPLTTRKLKTTTPVPATSIMTSTTKISTTEPTNKVTEKNNRIITKIKASVLNNAVKNKTSATTVITTNLSTTTMATKIKTNNLQNETTAELNSTISENFELNNLQPEAKDGAIELLEKSATTTKRPRRPTTPSNNNNKRKKNNNNNKNRRRKPAATASEKTNTAVGNTTKPATKEKPIGTQIYNYLSREVMPTFGVGLVGLMVTAGLASYFLYPFGGLRRAYDNAQDRKDYYYDEYAAGGMAEEELIGKVIAGMPEHTDYVSPYRTPLARKDAYRNDIHYNYRHADPYYAYPNNNDFQTVSVGSKLGYGRDVVAEHQKESGYTVDDGELEKNQFVVGNIPKDFEPVTPDPVPEHGPRKLRLRRHAQNDNENEIDFKYKITNNKPIVQSYYKQKISSTSTTSTTTDIAKTTEESGTTTEGTILLQSQPPNFFSFLKNLLELKVRYGLDLLLKTTDSFSNYLRGVQERVNTVIKEDNSRTPPR